MTQIVKALFPIIALGFAGAAGMSQAHVPSVQGRSVQVQGSGAEAHFSRGVQLMQEQLFEAAASEFEQALAANAAAPKAHFEFAVCLLSLGRNDEARRQFEQVQKLAGESRYVTYYLGRLDLMQGSLDSAIRNLTIASSKPPFPDTAYYLGYAYLKKRESSSKRCTLRPVTILTSTTISGGST